MYLKFLPHYVYILDTKNRIKLGNSNITKKKHEASKLSTLSAGDLMTTT